MARGLWLAENQVHLAEDRARDEVLIQQFKATGLLGAPRRTRRHDFGLLSLWRAFVHSPLALTSAMAVVVLGVGTWQMLPTNLGTTNEESVMRGEDQAVRVHADAPQEMARRIEQLLQGHGIRFRQLTLASGAVQIQALIPGPAQEVRQALLQQGVAVPPHGRLNLIISAR
jgi:hypothetical protein